MRLSLNDSIRKKTVVLALTGVMASVFILGAGLVVLQVMEQMMGLQEGLHQHTTMHFESLDYLQRYMYEGNPEDYEKFKEIRTRVRGVAFQFSMADGSYSVEEIREKIDSMGRLLGTMSTEEGKETVELGMKLRSNPMMAAMIQAAKDTVAQEDRFMAIMEEYRTHPDPEYRAGLKPKIDESLKSLVKAKENFTTAISDFKKWVVKTVRRVFVGTFVLFLALSVTASYFMGRSIVKPIVKAIRFSQRVSKGGFDRRLEVETKDETRDLAIAINAICEALRDLAVKIMNGAETLTESAQDLSSTANQFATTATETSASVSEINVTAQELKQAVQTSSENADSVASYAEHSAAIYEIGKKATEEMGHGMALINLEVVEVGERIARLSAQAVRIAEIIDMVDEVAHQSELLSVNASIEAAKAGEFGKGFQVVAAEVKTLSEQSKGATRQVRSILKEIQKAAEAAAKAAEQSASAVQHGLNLNEQASDSMSRLADSFDGAVAFTKKIASTSRQELQGVSQVTDALADIKDATQQNTAGAKLMESRSRELVQLAETLKKLVDNIKV